MEGTMENAPEPVPQLFVTPPPEAFEEGHDRPKISWVSEQEALLNQKYPGMGFQLEYRGSVNKMYIVRNKQEGAEGTTRPLDEWLAQQA